MTLLVYRTMPLCKTTLPPPLAFIDWTERAIIVQQFLLVLLLLMRQSYLARKMRQRLACN